MRLSIPRLSISGCVRFASAPVTRAALSGAVAGILMLTLAQQSVAHAGLSLPSLTALAACLALATELGRRWHAKGRHPHRGPIGYSVVAIWTVLSPWAFELAFRGIGLLPLETLANRAVQVACYAIVAALTTGWPLAVLVMAAPGSSRNGQGAVVPGLPTAWIVGFAGGLVMHAALVAPLVGLHLGGAFIAAAVVGLLLPAVFGPSECEQSGALGQAGGGDTLDSAPSPTLPGRAIEWALAAMLGALAFSLMRMGQQLSPAIALLLVAQWAALLAGLASGRHRMQTRLPNSGGQSAAATAGPLIGAAACAATMMIAQPNLESVLLSVNAQVSFVPLILGIRCTLAAVFLVPVGWAVGGLSAVGVPGFSRRRDTSAGRCPPGIAIAFVAGFLTLAWCLPGSHSLGMVTTALCVALAVAAVGLLVAAREFPAHWPARFATAAGIGLIAALLMVQGRYDPSRSAKLLFATNVLMARAAGLPDASLPVLDEARMIDVREGERGTLTAWKIRGVQVQIRENGIPKGVASTAPVLGPHYTAELMQAVAPLTLHEAPQRVLLLGLSSGVPLTTALEFPVREILCLESDPCLVDLVASRVWKRAELDPLADDRARCLAIDPALALRASLPPCDVIISNPDHSALSHASAEFTVEFYRRAAKRLADDGIFCQRFQRIDYGPEAVRVAVRSLQTAFRDVGVLEVAPGELLLLGTNSPKGLAREGMAQRLQTPQVRRTLAQVGWDWSVPLNLSAWLGEGLELFAESDSTVNTAANGRFTFGLPPEMMRWGPKWQEAQAAMAPHAGRFAATAAVDSTDPDLLRRLAEVTGHRKLMTAFPDQPWAYRKSIREQLVEHPRTVVQPVGGSLERVLHPEDERRKKYFETLAVAIREARSDVTTVDALSDFITPYDPLLSYFVHHEAAELYHRAGTEHARTELAHRLHMAYFANPADRSIRNLAAAIQLIAAGDDALPHPADRWDHLNALLQLLKVRWELRGTAPAANASVVLNDVDLTLAALDAGLAEMRNLADDVGIELEDWQARRDYLDRTLERPLRTYRTRLHAHHLKQQQKAEAQQADARPTARSETESESGLDPDAILRSMSEF